MTSKSGVSLFSSTEGFRMPHKRAPRPADSKKPTCGLGSCHPTCMQCCANIACFSATYAISGLVTSVLSIYISSQITTLERMFGLSSSISGFILSCNDIGYLLTTMFASYLARRTHIPRVLALTTFFYGLSGIVCIIPYFLTDVRLFSPGNASESSPFRGDKQQGLCQDGAVTSAYSVKGPAGNLTLSLETGSCGTEAEVMISGMSPEVRRAAIAILALGMMLQGFGKSPRYPFLSTFIDDNVERVKTPKYLGIITGISIFGPVLAFTLGSVFSRTYVTLEETDMSPRDPRWIGAWWLGFLAFGMMGLVAGLPLLCFPRRFRPPRPEVEKAKTSGGCGSHVKEFFLTILRLVTTPIYIFIVLGSCATLVGVAGLLTFGAKYLESFFFIPAWRANLVMGAMMVLAASIGSMLSGILISKLRFTPTQCAKVMVVTTGLGTVLGLSLAFLECPQPTIHRAIPSAGDVSTEFNFIASFNHSCDVSCDCDDVGFFPVCGGDGLTYFSPCQAGCTAMSGQTYNCSCLTGGHVHATPGVCPQDCSLFIPYLVLSVLGTFIATLGIMPGWVVYVRSVPEKDKPMAIGLSSFLATLIGWFPGPVIAGKVVDTACLLWSKSCNGEGSCQLYDVDLLRHRYNFLVGGVRGINFLCVLLVLVAIRCQKKPFYTHDDSDTVPSPEGEELMPTTREDKKVPL